MGWIFVTKAVKEDNWKGKTISIKGYEGEYLVKGQTPHDLLVENIADPEDTFTLMYFDLIKEV